MNNRLQALSNYQRTKHPITRIIRQKIRVLFSFAFSQRLAILTQKIVDSGYENVENRYGIKIPAKELTRTIAFVYYKDRKI